MATTAGFARSRLPSSEHRSVFMSPQHKSHFSKRRKKRNFIVHYIGFTYLSKIIWDLIHYLPIGISRRLQECPGTADIISAAPTCSLAHPAPRSCCCCIGSLDTWAAHREVPVLLYSPGRRSCWSSFNSSSWNDSFGAYKLISVTSGSVYETSPSRVTSWCHKFQLPLPLRNANNENSSKSSNNFYCWLDGCIPDYSKLMADLRVLKNSCHREIYLQTNT